MSSLNPAEVVDHLISVFQGALRGVPLLTNKQAQTGDLEVWEAGKLLRDRPTKLQSPVLQPCVVDSIRRNRPNVREIEQSLVGPKIPCKRRKRKLTDVRSPIA